MNKKTPLAPQDVGSFFRVVGKDDGHIVCSIYDIDGNPWDWDGESAAQFYNSKLVKHLLQTGPVYIRFPTPTYRMVNTALSKERVATVGYVGGEFVWYLPRWNSGQVLQAFMADDTADYYNRSLTFSVLFRRPIYMRFGKRSMRVA